MIEQLLALLALLAGAFAVSLTHSALARRRLKKSSIYLCRKGPDGREGPHANSAVSANRPEPARFVSRPVLNTSSIRCRTNQA